MRPPITVVRLSRMGAMFPTRLSLLRSLICRLASNHTQVTRQAWKICADGFGHAVFSIDLGDHTCSLVAVTTDQLDRMRIDRMIATP
jgi:hypothetical protein